MITAVVGKDMKYIDQMKGFKNDSENQMDTGYDRRHYGPRANRLIAELISVGLEPLHV